MGTAGRLFAASQAVEFEGTVRGAIARTLVRWGDQLDPFKNQFLSVAEVAAWATVRVFFLGAVWERDEAVSGRLPWV